jgi:hypothetical protein
VDNLTEHQLTHIGLMSFNQWPWTTAALVETGIAAHQIGSKISVAFWSDKTPLRDPGWNTSHRVARLLRSTPIEDSARDLIQAAGVPDTAFAEPPIKSHRPKGLPQLPTPLTRSAIRQLAYHGSGMGRSILQVHPDFKTPSREDFVWPRRWVRRAIRSYAWVYDQTLALIRQRNLSTIVVFNGRFTHDRAAAAAAESVGAKVLYYDYGGLETYFDLTHTTTHDWHALQLRMLSMWNRWGSDREEIATAWFRNREAHTEAGIGAFVGMQNHGFIPDLPKAERLVVFFSSSPDEMAELDLNWQQYFQSQENAVRTLARVCSELPNTALVVRTHPHMLSKPADDRQRWIAAVNSIGNNTHIGPDSPTDSYALMRVADRVITYGSTTGVESAFQGKPVAVLGPSAYHLLGCVTPIRTAEELRQWIIHPNETDQTMSMPYGLMMQRRGFNLAWLSEVEKGSLRRNEAELKEASSLAKKLSDASRTIQLRWLLQ